MRSTIRHQSYIQSTVGSQSLARLRSVSLISCSQLVRRADRPWFTLVFVPIVMLACVVTLHLLLLLPLAALCWWWGSTEDRLMWVLGILEAAWGVQWACLGLFGYMDYPHARPLVAVLWIGYALVIAGIGAANRWKYNRRYGM